jgi:hypothetical protein
MSFSLSSFLLVICGKLGKKKNKKKNEMVIETYRSFNDDTISTVGSLSL